MRKTDIEAVGDLAGEALAATGGLVQEMHEGIAARPFGILGATAAPVRAVHDEIAGAVYSAVRGGLRAATRGSASLLARRAADDGPALAAMPRGALALGAINGLFGHHLGEDPHPLAFPMEVRRAGESVPLTREGIANAFPDATSRVVVFVHGLCGDEDHWRLFPLAERAGRRTYGERLQEELGLTSVELRYNTGLRISRNGRELARLLDRLVAGWPTPVEEIVLVGHSMGGLVARSACHYGREDPSGWTDLVRHVFSLGTPHLGADLEKGVNALTCALGRVPETRAIASFLNARSLGIKDLRYGSCLDEDWCDCDPDEFLRDRCQEVPFLPNAHYYFIGAAVTQGPLGSALGDLLVRIPSASGRGNGRGRRIPFKFDHGHELTGLTHFDLLNHPAVYDQIRAWIACPPERPAHAASSEQRAPERPVASWRVLV